MMMAVIVMASKMLMMRMRNEDDIGEDDNGVVDTGFQCSGHLRIQAQWGVEPGCCLQRRYICIFGW